MAPWFEVTFSQLDWSLLVGYTASLGWTTANYNPNVTVSHFKRLTSSAVLLQELQLSHINHLTQSECEVPNTNPSPENELCGNLEQFSFKCTAHEMFYSVYLATFTSNRIMRHFSTKYFTIRTHVNVINMVAQKTKASPVNPLDSHSNTIQCGKWTSWFSVKYPTAAMGEKSQKYPWLKTNQNA